MIQRDLSKSWIEDVEYFKQQKEIGDKYLKLICDRLQKEYSIPCGLFEDEYSDFRENPKQIKNYTANNKDLWIINKNYLFEGKSRNINFQTKEDWPMNLWPMFVDTVEGFDAKIKKPLGYIFISQFSHRLLATSVKQHKNTWSEAEKFDTCRKIKVPFYFVDEPYVMNEEELIEKLKQLQQFHSRSN